MAGNTVVVTKTLSWTRGEFSTGSRSYVYENSANDPTTATRIYNLTSTQVSASLYAEVPLTGSTTRYYWVSHALQDSTEGTKVATGAVVFDGAE